IPKVPVVPKVPVIPKLPAPAADNAEDQPAPAADNAEDQPDAVAGQQPKGVRVVPLRPVRTGKGYRSVYADLTRTTVGSVVRMAIRGTGELLITFGLVVLLFAAYETWGRAAIVDAHQNDLSRQLTEQWNGRPTVAPSAPPSTAVRPDSGTGIAALYIPR